MNDMEQNFPEKEAKKQMPAWLKKTGLALKLMEEILNDREKEILKMRFGLGGRKPRTQREVAQLLGISRSYVSRIEKSALDQLRQRMKKVTRFR